jgi:integrator complex subunit 2
MKCSVQSWTAVWVVLLQGYPRELLPVTTPGIPSMHICLDFIPELLSQPSLEKQVFAVDLVSHLAVQYAMPKSLSVARLAINTLSTLLGGRSLHVFVHHYQEHAKSDQLLCGLQELSIYF